MLDVFRGWKRKLGLVILVLACLSAGVWTRGKRYGNDTVTIPISDSRKYVVGIPPAGYWFTRQLVKQFVFKNGGGTMAIEYEWIFVIPYWAVTLPLTLASACLLLSKPPPKMRRPPPPLEPEPEK